MKLKKKYKWLIACLFVCVACRMSAQDVTGADTLVTVTMHGTYYSDRFVGRKTSSGEVFSQQKYTAAHYSLPFGTLLLVTNPNNGRQVIVRVNDRCPKRNVLDMSRIAAKQIGIGSLSIQVTTLPQRYYSFWENQEQIVDVLKAGKFWEYIGIHHVLIAAAPAPSADEAKSQQPADAAKTTNKTKISDSSKSAKTTSVEPNERDTQLYDIELCRCKSRNTARKKVEQMPIYYQDKVEYETNVSANEVIVMLYVSQKEERARTIAKDLSAIFPDAKIIKIK